MSILKEEAITLRIVTIEKNVVCVQRNSSVGNVVVVIRKAVHAKIVI